MGLEKAGLKLINAWAKTSERSLLATKPVKVNPKSLGYIRPNGEIAFQSNDAALEFAKNEVVGALKVAKPYEKAVVLKDNIIKGISNGDTEHVVIPEISAKNLTVVHGHPMFENGLTTPISIPDAETQIINLDKYDKVIAYNAAGEYSMLSQIPQGKSKFCCETKYTGDLPKAIDLKAQFPDLFHAGEKKLEKQLQNIKSLIAQGKVELLFRSFKEFILKGKSKTQVQSTLNECSPETIQKIHQYWKKFANIYGLEYKTNYSYLK